MFPTSFYERLSIVKMKHSLCFLYELVFLAKKRRSRRRDIDTIGQTVPDEDRPGGDFPGSCNNCALFFYRAPHGIAENEYQTFPEGNPSRRKLKNVIKKRSVRWWPPVFPLGLVPRGMRSKQQRW